MKEAVIAGFISAKLKIENEFFLELKLVEKTILEGLVKQINSDIATKIEQDVEIISVDLVNKNALDIKGRAGVMGIKKEFTIHSKLLHDLEKDMISLKVGEIEVQGGFLVRKGFAMVENMIREKIESSAKIELGKVLKSLSPMLAIPGSDQKLAVKIEAFDLSTFELIPMDEEMEIRVQIKKAEVVVGKGEQEDES